MNTTIPIRGKRSGFAKVDADMVEVLSQYRWCTDSAGYAITTLYHNGIKQSVRMHTAVNGTPLNGMVTDHINGCKTDNTRQNLRICPRAKNNANQKPQSRKKWSKFKGVCFSRGKWMAYIGTKGTRTYLGATFASDREAAAAYNKAAVERYGEFALLNEF